MPTVPSTTPISEQIATDIREQIARGDLRPGDRIPTERALVEYWGVAKMTVARAISRLKSEGLVHTLPGVGVAVLNPRAGLSPSAQLWRMRTAGRIRLPNEHSVILQAGVERSDRIHPAITAAIGQTEESGETLFRRRLIYRDDQPLCMATSWFASQVLSPQAGWPQVRERLLDPTPIPEGTPMLIAELVGETPEREDYTANAAPATLREAEHLQVNPGAPILQVFSTIFGQSWPLECGVYSYPAGVSCGFPSADYAGNER